MKLLKISILVFIAIKITSCDCLQHVQGFVIDSETRLPIENVVIKEKGKDWVIHTDSLGYFELTSMTTSLFSCPNMSISFKKEGYDKNTKKYRSCCTDSTIVVLQRN